jgi:DNA excision repair protein ERCC-3
LTEQERLTYATAEQEDKYRTCSTAASKTNVVIDIVKKHKSEQTLIIGQYIDQIDELAIRLDVPIIKGDTPLKVRESLYSRFRSGELNCLVVSKVANFSVDLPEASIAIQVSGTFGSRQEEAQRLGRVLRPKKDGRTAKFYSIIARDTVDQDFAQNRQRFLAEQGYSYQIIDSVQI